MKTIATTNAPAAVGPYAQAVEANGFLFVSGQLPIDPATGRLLTGDIRTATRQVLENIRAILEAAELTLNDVVKCEVFLDDMNDFAAMNEVYAEFFIDRHPARQAVEVARLPKDAGIEISCIAVRA